MVPKLGVLLGLGEVRQVWLRQAQLVVPELGQQEEQPGGRGLEKSAKLPLLVGLLRYELPLGQRQHCFVQSG